MRRLGSVLLWSIIAAAFIGPGTVTTAAAAGAQFGYRLLWALLFSTLATLLLQEAAARLTIASGRTLGQAIRARYRGTAAALPVLLLVLGAVVLGNAAYEAGNILGAAAGAALGIAVPGAAVTLAIGAGAGALLWSGAPRTIARLLSATVAIMGVAFFAAALLLRPDAGAMVSGALLPVIPAGAGLLVLGLVGTTVVPYNLFLGSGLAVGQSLGEIRFGLTVAVLLGGLISGAVLVVGASLEGAFSFAALAAALSERLGPGAGALMAWGLFAAGFSSATTAPLAAAVTARSLLEDGSGRWGERSWRYRSVWGGVLAVGIVFGLAGVRPIPAILLAQALNGVLLPFVAVFLLLAVNDRRLMGVEGLSSRPGAAALAAVMAVTVVLGAAGVLRAAAAVAGRSPPHEGALIVAGAAVALVLAPFALAGLLRARRESIGRPDRAAFPQ
jgi:manganese transport protein